MKRALPDTVSYGQIKVVAALRNMGGAWFQGAADGPPRSRRSRSSLRPRSRCGNCVPAQHIFNICAAERQEQFFRLAVPQLAAPR